MVGMTTKTMRMTGTNMSNQFYLTKRIVRRVKCSFAEFLRMEAESISTYDDENGRSIDIYGNGEDHGMQRGIMVRIAEVRPNSDMMVLFPDKLYQEPIDSTIIEKLVKMEAFTRSI